MGKALVYDETAPRELPLPDMTYEEFLVHPDVPERAEWIDGRAIALGTVSQIHNDAVQFLIRLLGSFLEAGAQGRQFHDPFNMKLEPGLPGRCPDITVVLAANYGRLRPNFLEGPADIAVEVISAGTGAVDRGAKFDEYEAAGVTEYWLIDPIREVAEFYRLEGRGRYELVTTPDDVFRSEVLPGFFLRVEWLWSIPKVRDAEAALGLR